MRTTTFRFFKNTPLIDFQNTIHFNSNSERDHFFLKGGHYDELLIDHDNFNFIRDRSTVVIEVPYDAMRGVNYCTFLSDFERVRYYAYVMNYELVKFDTVRVYLLIDGIMTFTQGNVLEKLSNLTITRQHLSYENYKKSLWELKNNDDIIKTNTKSYFKTERLIFSDLIVLISSSVDLVSNFGKEDNPKIKTSRGRQFDKITAPLNLYVCDFADFNRLMGKLSQFPWISQNIKSMMLVPRIFLDDNLTKIRFSDSDSLNGVDYLYEITGLNTNKKQLKTELVTISKSMNDLYEFYNLDPVQDCHLLRNEYATIELYNYSGGALYVDTGQLNQFRGLELNMDIVMGYHNEMKVYIDQYRVNEGLGHKNGSYINDSLTFDSFDDMPMLIDNASLSRARTANQRALTESKLVSNRIKNVMNPNASLKDRFMDGASLISNFSPSNLFGKFSDEQDYYKQQKAEQADLALEAPSITNQTTGNSFSIANNNFGVHIKYSKPSESELIKIKKYYKLFGYETNDYSNSLDSITSMNVCNYVQFSGSWSIPDTDVAIIEMMKAQFENGVRLWHNKDISNPMQQDVLNNKMVVN